MLIGACRLTFRLHGNASLKGKRQVAKPLTERMRQRLNVAVAEVEGMDQHQRLVLGIACVSNDARHADEVLDAVIALARDHHLDAELVGVEREILDGP